MAYLALQPDFSGAYVAGRRQDLVTLLLTRVNAAVHRLHAGLRTPFVICEMPVMGNQ
jgi:hypothetical protein